MPPAIDRSWHRAINTLHARAEISGAVLGALCAILFLATGAITRLEQRVSDAWFSIADTAPSGRTVLVPIDRAIAAGGDSMYLPHAVLADLLLKLNDAGASRILIAVNLAAKTTTIDDAKLRDALAALGRAKVGLARATVVSGSGERARWRRMPVGEQFAEFLTLTASDLALDADAQLRYDGLDKSDLEPLPWASAWLAGRQHGVDRRFRIDFGINLAQIPVVDAADILAADLSRPELNGARVIIGSYSSAFKYGIRVPRYGELRRAEVIALASETILLQRQIWTLSPILAAGVLIMLSAAVGFWAARLNLPAGIGALVGISLCSIALGANLQVHYGLIVPTAGLIAATLVGIVGAQVARRLRRSAQARRNEIEILQMMATRDSLTGLLNRRSFERELANASGALNANFAVLLCDLDGFKQVNDTLGHQAGDMLLREVAIRLASTIGAHGIAARLGGDEFAVLLMNATPDSASEAARELVTKVSEPITISGEDVKVGMSIGIALGGSMSRRADDLLARADAAMYQAKRVRSGFKFENYYTQAA